MLLNFRTGQRTVSMVATNVDEVATHFVFLKKELDRRTCLSEDDLEREPVLLIYVEEMLSLQYEVTDPKTLEQMLAHLTILAVRGRKYRMFLLCCTQTDYSTPELRIAQKQFRFRAAGGIDMTAARAAGFMNTDLIKENFQTGVPGQGQFVVEFPSFSDIVLAPRYDWKEQLPPRKQRFAEFSGMPPLEDLNPPRNTVETTLKRAEETDGEAKVDAVRDLRSKNWGKVAIIEKIWNVKAGGSLGYKSACAEYEQIIASLDETD